MFAGAGEALDAALDSLKPERIVGAGAPADARRRDDCGREGRRLRDVRRARGAGRQCRSNCCSNGSPGGRKFSRRRASPTPNRSRRRRRLAAAGADFVAVDDVDLECVLPSRPCARRTALLAGARRDEASPGRVSSWRCGARPAGAAAAQTPAATARRRARSTAAARGRRRRRRRFRRAPTGKRRTSPSAPISAATSCSRCGRPSGALDAESQGRRGDDADRRHLSGRRRGRGKTISKRRAGFVWRATSAIRRPPTNLAFCCSRARRACRRTADGAKAQFERAAAQEPRAALYNLGVMALDSTAGRKPDFAAAARYFLRAANAGDDDGAYSYGVMLREGKGVPQDVAEGAHWLKRAADAGVIAGQVEYAIMLFNGEGVPQGPGRARSDPARGRRQGQSDRPEPSGASLRRRRRRRPRSRQGRGLERFRQGGRASGSVASTSRRPT